MIRLFFVLSLLTASLLPAQTPDPGGLVIAILQAAKQDAGFGPDAAHPPIVAGPVLVDSTAFDFAVSIAFGPAAAADLGQLVLASGYSFGEYDGLLRSAAGSEGITNYWLDGDPLLIRVHSFGGSATSRSVHVSNLFNYQGFLCVRLFELRFDHNGSQWHLSQRRLVLQC